MKKVECKNCGIEIPMPEANEFDGYCEVCAYEKSEDEKSINEWEK